MLCEYCSHNEGKKEIIEVSMAVFSRVYFAENRLESFWIAGGFILKKGSVVR